MILLRWLISTLSVMFVAYLLPDISVASFYTALWAALLLGLANAIVRPILIFFTLPITILSLGFFVLIINAFLFMLVSSIVGGFEVDGFWAAFTGSLILWVVGWVANALLYRPIKSIGQ